MLKDAFDDGEMMELDGILDRFDIQVTKPHQSQSTYSTNECGYSSSTPNFAPLPPLLKTPNRSNK